MNYIIKYIFTSLILAIGLFGEQTSNAQSIELGIDSDKYESIMVTVSDDGVAVGYSSLFGMIPWISDSKILFFDDKSIGIINPQIEKLDDSVAEVVISNAKGRATVKYENGRQETFKISDWPFNDRKISDFRSKLIQKYGNRTRAQASGVQRKKAKYLSDMSKEELEAYKKSLFGEEVKVSGSKSQSASGNSRTVESDNEVSWNRLHDLIGLGKSVLTYHRAEDGTVINQGQTTTSMNFMVLDEDRLDMTVAIVDSNGALTFNYFGEVSGPVFKATSITVSTIGKKTNSIDRTNNPLIMTLKSIKQNKQTGVITFEMYEKNDYMIFEYTPPFSNF